MKGTLGDLRMNTIKMQELLRGDLYAIASEETTTILSSSRDLISKIDSIEESFLTIGILGGTGVGKSTLMNALAGKKITSASYLRPHTDDTLIYRHIDAPIPSSLPTSEISWRDCTHDEALIKGILLCDLPDFDSLIGEHQERVIEFLDYLDLLIWVTSPEKYGDKKFYEFLRLVPRSKENFCFVLNKTDILFEGKPGNDALDEVATITGYLREYLNDEGLTAPPVYVISSREVLEGKSIAPWNQFPSLRQAIFRQRNFKEIKEIKGANLESEYELLLNSFEKEISFLETIKGACAEVLAVLEKGMENSANNLNRDIVRYFEKNPDDFGKAELDDLSSLVGPSRGFAAVMREWRQFARKERTREDSEKIAGKIRGLLEKHYAAQEDCMVEHLLRHGFSSTIVGLIKDVINGSTERSDYHESLEGLFENPQARLSLFSKYSFKSVQYGIYLILFSVMIFSLTGEAAWQNLFNTPGLRSILHFLLKVASTLFSPKGAAALGTYLILNLFAGYHFYRAFVRRHEKESRKSRVVVQKAVTLLWKRRLDLMKREIEGYNKAIVSRISAISGLKG